MRGRSLDIGLSLEMLSRWNVLAAYEDHGWVGNAGGRGSKPGSRERATAGRNALVPSAAPTRRFYPPVRGPRGQLPGADWPYPDPRMDRSGFWDLSAPPAAGRGVPLDVLWGCGKVNPHSGRCIPGKAGTPKKVPAFLYAPTARMNAALRAPCAVVVAGRVSISAPLYPAGSPGASGQ